MIDTLVFEPDLGHFTMSWRCSLPLKKSIFELLQVVVGTKPFSWYREERLQPARAVYKLRFSSLRDLVRRQPTPAPEGP
jgi:hypothetical protein